MKGTDCGRHTMDENNHEVDPNVAVKVVIWSLRGIKMMADFIDDGVTLLKII